MARAKTAHPVADSAHPVADSATSSGRLKEWRLLAGLTQEQLAPLLGVADRATVSRLERGVHELRPRHREHLTARVAERPEMVHLRSLAEELFSTSAAWEAAKQPALVAEPALVTEQGQPEAGQVLLAREAARQQPLEIASFQAYQPKPPEPLSIGHAGERIYHLRVTAQQLVDAGLLGDSRHHTHFMPLPVLGLVYAYVKTNAVSGACWRAFEAGAFEAGAVDWTWGSFRPRNYSVLDFIARFTVNAFRSFLLEVPVLLSEVQRRLRNLTDSVAHYGARKSVMLTIDKLEAAEAYLQRWASSTRHGDTIPFLVGRMRDWVDGMSWDWELSICFFLGVDSAGWIGLELTGWALGRIRRARW